MRSAGILALLFPIGMAIRRGVKKSSAHEVATGAGTRDGSFHMRLLMGSGGCQILDAAWGQMHRLAQDSVQEKGPDPVEEVEEGGDADSQDAHSQDKLLDLWGPTEGAVHERAREWCGGAPAQAAPSMASIPADTEVRCLICSGDSSNRIDVVFMGDGYQLSERERFFDDMMRLTTDMFEGETFQSYLPVFNIWAIHVPSVDSGIGYNGRSQNTPFGLYKQGQQHRGVFPSRQGRSFARQVCQLADGCDYPAIIGNDEFYGGLGGEFVIGTRSKTTGTIVLRHEMGHNFVFVGEEYDGGGVYRGVNSEGANTRGEPPIGIRWRQWLTEPKEALREEKMANVLQKYPWADLAAGTQSFTFTSDGAYARWKLTFTVSGCPEEGSIQVFLDGKQLPWTPTRPLGAERPDGTTVDRQFYYIEGKTAGLAKGTHNLTIKSGFAPPQGAPIRQLCSLTIHEFGSDTEFHTEKGYVGAYPTWDQRGRKTFRPTNDQCLMRDMESTVFCPVCKEGMWEQFFMRMTTIDAVDVSKSGETVSVQLSAAPLAHLREKPVAGLTESYTVAWSKDGEPQPQFAGQWSFTGAEAALEGNWEVELKYSTSEVRSDPNNLLTATQTFAVGTPATPAPAPWFWR